MGFVAGIAVPLLILAVAIWLARFEMRLYREAHEDGTDLFVYGKGRLIRRMIGVGVMVVTAVGIFWMEIAWSWSPRLSVIVMAILLAAVVLLLVVPLADLRETARTAKPEDLKRSGMTREALQAELQRMVEEQQRKREKQGRPPSAPN
jgi:MFS family permease